MFLPVTEENIATAGKIHSASWIESHKAFCTQEFIDIHTSEHQEAYIRREISKGVQFFLLRTESCKGIVSVDGSMIANLYVLPEEQRKGFGTALLHYAEALCKGTPHLWVLNNNHRAIKLYNAEGYSFSGKCNQLTDSLFELEMSR